MIDPDKIINDARNLEVANRAVQEERVKSAIILCLSKDDWDGIGVSANAEIELDPYDTDLAIARTTGKKIIQGSERFFEFQYRFRFSEVSSLKIGEGSMHLYPYLVNFQIPLSRINFEEIQALNNKTLSDLVLRIGS
jgi:hypothetical protein